MLSAVLALFGGVAGAQQTDDALPPGVTAVEPAGEPAAAYSSEELAELVGPIALYPDDLVAIVLPASTYPLQLVQAARFLERLEDDPGLKPDPQWDESVVALLNYPEVMRLLNDDLDWSWRLGEAVLAQEADVIEAIERFRDRAWLAGNLRSDERQQVTRDEGVVRIIPADPEVIYVPYYEPRRVVYYSPLPVYHYYPLAYPSYYYPYPAGYAFSSGFFWGVTSAFAIGWNTHFIHVHHYGFPSHPFYGRSYYDRYFYRRPVVRAGYRRPALRDRQVRLHAGNRWQPAYRAGARPHRVRAGRVARADARRDAGRVGNVRPDRRQPRLAAPVGNGGRDLGTRGAVNNRAPAARDQRRQLVARDQRMRPNPSGAATTRSNRQARNPTQASGLRGGERARADDALQRRQNDAARLASRSGAPGNPNRLGLAANRGTTGTGRSSAPRANDAAPERQRRPGAQGRLTQPRTQPQANPRSGNAAATGSRLAFSNTPSRAPRPAAAPPVRPNRPAATASRRNAPATKRFAAPSSGQARSVQPTRSASRSAAPTGTANPGSQRRMASAPRSSASAAAPRARAPQRSGTAAPTRPLAVAPAPRASRGAAAPSRQASPPPAPRAARESSRAASPRRAPERGSGGARARERRDR
jgi:hypothetical protein